MGVLSGGSSIKFIINLSPPKEWVAKEYSKRCKKGARKKENTKEVLKCWNLEPVIDADLIGDSQPSELIMNELVNGCKADPSASSTTKEVQEVVEVND